MTGAQAVQALLLIGYRFRLLPERKLFLKYLDSVSPPPTAAKYIQALKSDIQSAVWLVDLMEKGFEPVEFAKQTIVKDNPYAVEAYLLAEKRYEIKIERMAKHPKYKNNAIIIYKPLVPPCFIDIDKYTKEVTPEQISIYDAKINLPAQKN